MFLMLVSTTLTLPFWKYVKLTFYENINYKEYEGIVLHETSSPIFEQRSFNGLDLHSFLMNFILCYNS